MNNLKIDYGRLKHMHGCAEYMYQNAEKYNLEPSEMYFLGYIHDIGYINGKSDHEDFGGDLLENIGIPKYFADYIRWHGTTPQEYMDLHMCYDDDIPKELILLWEADMHVDLSGEDVGYEKRLEGIKTKYGIDSHAYYVCKNTIYWLLINGIK